VPSLLAQTIAAIGPLDSDALVAAAARQAQLTKPAGSMGRLEGLGERLSGMYAACPPPIPAPVAVAVFAADHGVWAQGVSPWPQEVTVQMVASVATGGAVVSVLADQVGASVVVVDVGVAGEVPPGLGVVDRKIASGTGDFSVGPAMTAAQCQEAIEVGITIANQLIDDGVQLLVTGDLGIGNTTASAALIAAMTGAPAVDVTGPGAGSDAAMVAHKASVIEQALDRHTGPRRGVPGAEDAALTLLAAVGGFEHAALVGFMLGAAARRKPVLLDGVIACSAALVAHALCPGVTDYLIAGHRSSEPGATAALAALGLTPLLDLDLRLGEGSGAVLAVPLVQASARLLRDVATFDSAGVSGRSS
jgi:nicotinate-nucleotide--dimethylbenzimidazole phosphoribosyltransferase